MNSESNVVILLVEDDAAIASTLRYAFTREGWQVHWCDSIGQALDFVQQSDCPPLAALVLDIGLPDGDGFALCQQIRFGTSVSATLRQVPIVFLTARDEEVDKIVGLEVGADDYITKPFSPREVIARLKAIWRRQQMSHTDSHANHPTPSLVSSASTPPIHLTHDFVKTLASGQWRYYDAQVRLTWDDVPLTLSKTELAIMLALLTYPEQILSREQILVHISPHPEHRLARTIDSHVKSLRQKLASIRPDVTVISTHRGLGYSLQAAD